MVQGKEEGLTMEGIRTQCLKKACHDITGQREQDYGSPKKNFSIISGLWSSYLGVEVTPLDVSMMMCLLKISRIKSGGGTGDSFSDIAGYAACGAEIRAADNKFIAAAKPEDDDQQNVSFF